jgi:ATP-dependent Lhr-like helicase
MLTRAAYAQVVLCAGRLVAWLRRGNPNLLVFLPADEPERSHIADGLARFLAEVGQTRLQQDQAAGGSGSHHSGYLISTVNGVAVAAHPMARALHDAGFNPGPLGMHLRRPARPPSGSPNSPVSGLAPDRPTPEQAALNRPALTRPDFRQKGV